MLCAIIVCWILFLSACFIICRWSVQALETRRSCWLVQGEIVASFSFPKCVLHIAIPNEEFCKIIAHPSRGMCKAISCKSTFIHNHVKSSSSISIFGNLALMFISGSYLVWYDAPAWPWHCINIWLIEYCSRATSQVLWEYPMVHCSSWPMKSSRKAIANFSALQLIKSWWDMAVLLLKLLSILTVYNVIYN